MMKLLKLWSVALLLVSSQAMAKGSFDSIKEELWLKGESALGVQAQYYPEQAISLNALESFDQAIQNDVPEELEVGLNLWLAQK